MDEETSLLQSMHRNDFLNKMKTFGQTFGSKKQQPQVLSHLAESHLEREYQIVDNLLQPHHTNANGSAMKDPSLSHSAAVSDNLKADLDDILKKSTENSAFKSRAQEKKSEYDKLLLSGRKNQPILMDAEGADKERMEKFPTLPSFSSSVVPDNTYDKNRHGGKVSRRSQGLLEFLGLGAEEDDEQSLVMANKEGDDEMGGRERQKENDNKHNTNPQASKIISSMSKPVVVEDNNTEQKMILGPLLEMSVVESVPEVSSIQDDSPDRGLSEVERLDFENEKRSRRSYFPEQLQRRIKPNTRDSHEMNSQPESVSESIKGPFFDMYSSSASSTRLAELFTRLSDGVEDNTLSMGLQESLNNSIRDKREWIRTLDVETLLNFDELLGKEIAQNEAFLKTSPLQISQLPETENFEEMVRLSLQLKLLTCLNFSSRVDLLNRVSLELDKKTMALKSDMMTIDTLVVPQTTERAAFAEDTLWEMICREFDLHYFRKTIIRDSKDFETTFVIGDVLFFTLMFEHRVDDRGSDYWLKSGMCRQSPILHQTGPKANNPLNNPNNLSAIFNRMITAAVSDSQSMEGLHFLIYLGYEYRRLEDMRHSLNQCIIKHKISDVSVDQTKYFLQFLMFPKFSRVRFSLKLTVGLLASDTAELSFSILSSAHKKKNLKVETFAELEDKLTIALLGVSTLQPNWLATTVGIVSNLINEGGNTDAAN